MHQLSKQASKQKFPQVSQVNFQYLTEADVCSMPPPSKQAKISLVDQATCGNVSNGTVLPNLRNAHSSKINTNILSDVSVKENVTIPSTSLNSGHDLQDTVRSLITCAICLEIQGQAYQCANGHLICVNCATRLIQQHTNSGATCPSCRVPLHLGLRRCLLAEQLAAELPCQCRFCGAQMARKLIENHETVKCSERPVLCRFSIIGCQWTGRWIELDNHIGQCTYKDKRISETEPILATALEQNQIMYAERNQFQRGLLTQLAKASTGLKAFRRQIGVFRDPTQPDTTKQFTCSTSVYQSTSNQFRCCGLRRVVLETMLNPTEGQLCYRIKSKSEQSSEISFHLCLVRCGDVEFDVIDQLHSFHFGPNQKETPSYKTTLVYHRASEARNETDSMLSQLTVQSSYVGFPMETLKQANNLLLEFILLKDRCDVLEVRLNGNNNEYHTTTRDILPEVTGSTNSEQESTNEPAADEIQGDISTENNASQTYWQQILHSPSTSLLRPLLNLFFSNRERETGNNNAPFVFGSLPQSIVVTLTNLSPTDTRIRVVGLDNGTQGTLEDTENEDDSEENSSAEDEAVEDEENVNTSEDEFDSSDESEDSGNQVHEQVGERNNNALDEDPSKEDTVKFSDRSAGNLLASESSLATHASSCQLLSPVTSATNRSNSNVPPVEKRKILCPARHNNARNLCNPQRGTSTNATVSGIKRTGQHLRRGNGNGSTKNPTTDDNCARPNLSDFDVGPSDPKRVEQQSETMTRTSTTVPPKQFLCRSAPWFQNVIHKFTGIARFLVRTPVATPLSYLTAFSENSVVSDNQQNTSASENPGNVHCAVQLEQNPFSLTTSWTLPMDTSDIVNESSYAPNSMLDKTKYLPVDSLPPRMRSLRADILQEIINLARRATSRELPATNTQLDATTTITTTTTTTTTTEDNMIGQNNLSTVHSEQACQTASETQATNSGTCSRNKNTSNKYAKHTKRPVRPPHNRQRNGRKK